MNTKTEMQGFKLLSEPNNQLNLGKTQVAWIFTYRQLPSIELDEKITLLIGYEIGKNNMSRTRTKGANFAPIVNP